jgi:hypothetical protein
MFDLLYLVMLLTLPLVLPIIIITFAYGEGGNTWERFKGIFQLHVDRGLSEQRILWLSIIVPLIYFLSLGFIAWSGHHVLLTSDGLVNFVRISSLPIAVASLAIPFSVLIARFHSSRQTAEQIKITRQKNNIDLFHSHRKEFFSYFSQIGTIRYLDRFDALFKPHPRLHINAFSGKPQDGQPISNELYFKTVTHELNSAFTLLNIVVKCDNLNDAYNFYVLNLCPAIYQLSHRLGLPEIMDYTDRSVIIEEEINGDSQRFITVGTTTEDVLAACRYAHGFFMNLCDFASYEFPGINDHCNYLLAGDSYKQYQSESLIEILHRDVIPNRKVYKNNSNNK